MSGLVNTSNTGIYSSLEPIILFGIGTSTNFQLGADMQSSVVFEGNNLDASDTIHAATLSLPSTSGLISGTTCMMAERVIDTSDIFTINNQAVANSGTIKVQNIGNCPMAPMVLSSGHNARFHIAK